MPKLGAFIGLFDRKLLHFATLSHRNSLFLARLGQKEQTLGQLTFDLPIFTGRFKAQSRFNSRCLRQSCFILVVHSILINY